MALLLQCCTPTEHEIGEAARSGSNSESTCLTCRAEYGELEAEHKRPCVHFLRQTVQSETPHWNFRACSRKRKASSERVTSSKNGPKMSVTAWELRTSPDELTLPPSHLSFGVYSS